MFGIYLQYATSSSLCNFGENKNQQKAALLPALYLNPYLLRRFGYKSVQGTPMRKM